MTTKSQPQWRTHFTIERGIGDKATSRVRRIVCAVYRQEDGETWSYGAAIFHNDGDVKLGSLKAIKKQLLQTAHGRAERKPVMIQITDDLMEAMASEQSAKLARKFEGEMRSFMTEIEKMAKKRWLETKYQTQLITMATALSTNLKDSNFCSSQALVRPSTTIPDIIRESIREFGVHGETRVPGTKSARNRARKIDLQPEPIIDGGEDHDSENEGDENATSDKENSTPVVPCSAS